MEILIKDDNDIAKAHKAYDAFTQDEELRDLYEAREKWRKDYNSGLYYARQEGRKEGKLETAENMYKLGIDIDKIQQATGLSSEEILKTVKD